MNCLDRAEGATWRSTMGPSGPAGKTSKAKVSFRANQPFEAQFEPSIASRASDLAAALAPAPA
jgi:hypothetical protein